MRPRTAPFFCAVTALLLTGCGAAGGGTPQPTEKASAPSSGVPALPHSGAPKVPNPLDVKTLQAAQDAPCGTLTDAQARGLGLDPQGEFDDAPTGPACSWANDEAGSLAHVLFPVEIIYQGLSQYYEKRHRDPGDIFYAMPPVDGFPVIATGIPDDRQFGTCLLQIGLTDEQVVQVSVDVSRAKRGKSEPCQAAHGVAEMVVENIAGSR